MTMEVIFMGVTAIVTAILGMFFKDSVIPSRFIPIQNLIIGVISAVLAAVFGLFDSIALAIAVSLFTAFGVGGLYDLAKTKK